MVNSSSEKGRRVCPWWVGYLLIHPIRRFLEDPRKMLAPLVQEGMTVLEPGPGMGYFTLPLARMVGPQGRVVVVEVQDRMLFVLARRARKAGLLNRLDLRKGSGPTLGIEDLTEQVDLAVALHMTHEMPDARAFFQEVWQSLKPGGHLLVVEPTHHVSAEAFGQTVATARQIGFHEETPPTATRGRSALFIKAFPEHRGNEQAR